MKYLTSDKFKEGIKIHCKIKRIFMSTIVEILDAKLHYEDGQWFICQNRMNGMSCINRLGYEYSWAINTGTEKDLKKNNIIEIKLNFSLKNRIRILKKELCK
jgi:hypothetical protein